MLPVAVELSRFEAIYATPVLAVRVLTVMLKPPEVAKLPPVKLK
jgi:hypothetical protein